MNACPCLAAGPLRPCLSPFALQPCPPRAAGCPSRAVICPARPVRTGIRAGHGGGAHARTGARTAARRTGLDTARRTALWLLTPEDSADTDPGRGRPAFVRRNAEVLGAAKTLFWACAAVGLGLALARLG